MKNKLPPKPFLCPQYILATKLFSISACFAKNKKKTTIIISGTKISIFSVRKKRKKKKSKRKIQHLWVNKNIDLTLLQNKNGICVNI
jgi:hypothetical protein